jgi:dCMP deaminase
MDWDSYFLSICQTIAEKSSCHSRKIGAILVKDHAIISTGYNGPPRKIAHCNPCCPRREQGFVSGEGLHLCRAVHAEVNCIAQAARNGVITKNATMYMTCGIPCKNCAGVIINAGIKRLVCPNLETYDNVAPKMFLEAGVKIDTFK